MMLALVPMPCSCTERPKSSCLLASDCQACVLVSLSCIL
jgi:hypothetical protein